MSIIGPNTPFIPQDSENVSANEKQDEKWKFVPSEDTRTSAKKLKQTLTPIQNQKAELKKSAEKIKNLESPLLPKKDSTGSNVYPLSLESTNPHALFKPGKSNTSKAILCAKIAKMLDLPGSIPKTIQATASQILSKGDLDDSGKAIIYKRATINDKEYLVNPSDCFDIRYVVEEDDGTFTVKLANQITLQLTKDGDGYHTRLVRNDDDEDYETQKEPEGGVFANDEESIEFEEEADTEREWNESTEDDLSEQEVYDRELVEFEGGGVEHQDETSEIEEEDINPEDLNEQSAFFANDNEFLVLAEGAHALDTDDNGEYVQRGDMRFELEDSGDEEGYTLVGKDVEGFIQDWIPDVVTEINGETVDTLKPSAARDAFYGLIDTNSFMESALLAMLFRTQDGKASNLEDTNFLFIKSDSQLQLKLIDLDETWPTKNDISDDPAFAKEGAVCAFQLGLMGYPQAHMQLDSAQKEHVVHLLQKVHKNRAAMIAAIDKYEVDTTRVEAVKGAFMEVLDRLESFNTDKPFALRDLVFHVFPEYQKQWQALEALGLPREEVAKWVGKASVDKVTALRSRVKT